MFLRIGEVPRRDPLATGLQLAAAGLVRNTGQTAGDNSAEAVAALSDDHGQPFTTATAASGARWRTPALLVLIRTARTPGA